MSRKHDFASDNNAGLHPGSAIHWGGVIFAIAYPTAITWGYFIFAERYSTGVQQTTYLIVKIIQFAFPLLWVLAVLREPVRMGRLTTRGMVTGAAFGVTVVAGGWLLFQYILSGAAEFAGAAELILGKIRGFGIDSLSKFVVLATFYSIVHSLLEEYYWRWFVFRQLRQLVRAWPAIIVSAIGFTAHHVVVLGRFFQDAPLLACLFAAAVTLGGIFWAWLYERTDSLLGPWVSHLIIDAGIFLVGYELVRPALLAAG